ncbi:MAG: hypothetical protein R3B59_13185, partial [Dehalococcoidia bacterium]
ELGGQIEVEDLVSLDDFTCYARWWDGHGRPPAFSFRVDPPPRTTPGRAAAIAQRSALRVGRARDQVVEEITQVLSERSPADGSGRREQKSAQELAVGASEADAAEETRPASSSARDEAVDPAAVQGPPKRQRLRKPRS